MADSNPFAHLGLGMLGGDVGIARAAASPQPIFDKNPLRGLIGMGLDKMGVKDYLDSLTADNQTAPVGVAPPPVAGTGINPMNMAVVPFASDLSKTGLQNKAFVEGVQPYGYTMQNFGGSTGYSLPQSPYQMNQPSGADETRKQILSSWGL